MSRDSSNTPRSMDADYVGFSLDAAVRLIATLTGILTILLGLWLAVKLFGAIAHGVQSPDAYKDTFQQWTAVLGGDQLKIKLGEQEIAVGPALAVGAVGMGLSLLTWLTLGIMLTGAKVVSWTSGDREAVKRVLQHALGGRSPQ